MQTVVTLAQQAEKRMQICWDARNQESSYDVCVLVSALRVLGFL